MNYQSAMTVQQLADRANTSLRTYKRRFAQATGESPAQYLQKIRIEPS